MIFLVLINLVNADSVTQNDITITSDKHVYYCEPIFNEKGECLIKAKIKVVNKRNNDVDIDGATSFTTKSIRKTDFYLKHNNKFLTINEFKNKTKKIVKINKKIKNSKFYEKNKLEKLPIKKDEEFEILVQFWVNESGKFNYTANIYSPTTGNLLATVTLDPYYNYSVSTETPSYQLINGTAMNYSQDMFAQKIDITAGLSDDNTSTAYYSKFADSPVEQKYLVEGWSFNELSPEDTLFSFTGNNDGFILGNVSSIIDGDYYGHALRGDGAYIVHDKDWFTADGHYSICVKFRTENIGSTKYLFDNHPSSGDGYGCRLLSSGAAYCFFYGTTGSTTVSSSTNGLDDGNWHILCWVQDTGNNSIWVDGNLEGTTSSVGTMDSDTDLFIGDSNDLDARWEGDLSQFGVFNTSLNASTIASFGSESICNMEKGITLDPFFNYSIDTTKNASYYLEITSEVKDLSTIRIMAYKNMTDVNTSAYVTSNMQSGVSYISIDDIIYNGYNYPFRVWSLLGRYDVAISEIKLFEIGNDTITPNITNCQINTTNLTCGDTIRLSCNITDDVAIYKSFFFVNESWDGTKTYEANKNDSIWFVDLTYYDEFNTTQNLTFYFANTTDLAGNPATKSLSLNYTYECIATCNESWVANYSACLTNDSMLKTYYDENNCGTYDNLPADNGTYVYCNYCSEDLEKVYTTACTWNGTNGTINYTWTDNNYYTCCAITNLTSDCSILYYPYNESGTETCQYEHQDFELDVDSELFFGYSLTGLHSDKVYGKIWLNDTNHTYYCVSYVQTLQRKTLQTNPSYTKRSESAIQLFSKEIEDREFFVTHNGLANVYWTNDNLVIDGRNYIFGVECSGNGNRLLSEQLAKVFYEPVNAPITRWFWFKENVFPIMLGFILLIFVIMIIGLLIREFNNTRRGR